MTKPTTISFDEWTLHRNSGELERAGNRVRLPDLAHQILEALLEQPGELVTREQLIARLWPQGVVDFENSLNTAVRKLRSILGDDADTPRYIETVPRKGYRFIGRVAESVAAASAETVHGAPTTAPAIASNRKRKVMRVGATLLALVMGVLISIMALRSSSPTPPVANQTVRVRLAVLPFENLSPDPANAFFTDGMHEEVLSTLSNRATNMDVISRTTMMTYKTHPVKVSELAKELGVTHVLEGSVRRDGQTVRVTLQLIDARIDGHLWSQSYDRKLVNAMTLQSQVAEEVASQLVVKLASDNGALRPSSNPEAYDLYLKAKLSLPGIVANTAIQEYQQTEDWLNRAIALDPSFAGAYLERSRVRLRKFELSYDLSELNLQSVRSDLETVRKLAGDVPATLAVESEYASYVEWDMDRALSLIEAPQVVASNDSYVMTRRAVILGYARRLDESFALLARAAELDPRNLNAFNIWEFHSWAARRPAEALQARRAHQKRMPTTLGGGNIVYAYTGKMDPWASDVNRDDDSVDGGAQLAGRVQRLLHQNQIADAIELIERSDIKTIRTFGRGGLRIGGTGRRPIAELHGWVKLLSGDTAAAARDGRIVLDFVKDEPITKWNAWYLRFLAAEGALFTGNKTQATADARAALTMTPRDRMPHMALYANATAAQIFSWAGAEDEAVALLEELSKGFPSLGPAEITRDPLYSIPLKNNARYQALEKKLEAEIAENLKLL